NGAQVLVQTYRHQEASNPILETVYRNLTTPIQQLELPQGSYLLTFTAPERAKVRFPLLVARGNIRKVSLQLPTAARVPDGFIYVPPGTFLFGSSKDSSIRKDWLFTVPLHEVATDGYLIAANETTFGEWLEYLNALEPSKALRRAAEVRGPRKDRQIS